MIEFLIFTAGVFAGAGAVVLVGICQTSRAGDQLRLQPDQDEYIALTPSGYRALDNLPPANTLAQPEADPVDRMEVKARADRAERARRIRIENPQVFQPVLVNPDDPTDIVL